MFAESQIKASKRDPEYCKNGCETLFFGEPMIQAANLKKDCNSFTVCHWGMGNNSPVFFFFFSQTGLLHVKDPVVHGRVGVLRIHNKTQYALYWQKDNILLLGAFISIFPNQFKAPQGWKLKSLPMGATQCANHYPATYIYWKYFLFKSLRRVEPRHFYGELRYIKSVLLLLLLLYI